MNSSRVFAARHPLVEHHLARLRDKTTDTAEFRRLVHRLSVLLAYQATEDLPLVAKQVQTPITTADCRVNAQRIGLVPILRAGLGMVDGVLDLIPDAEVWHLGVYRDEGTAQPVEYYSKLPKSKPVEVAMVIDPMLATGGSALSALAALRSWGVPRLKLLSIIGSEEGIENVLKGDPDVEIHICTIDAKLNDRKFIVPGLGDAGDRIFNTHDRE